MLSAGFALLLACSRGGAGADDLAAPGGPDLAGAEADLAGADLLVGPDLAGPGSGDPVSSLRFGGDDSDYGHGVAVDRDGNVVIVGEFNGRMDLAGGALASAGLADVFVAKFAPGGAHLWSRRFGGNLSDSGRRIAIDRDGNVVVAGIFRGVVDFGGGPLTSAGEQDLFLAKYAPDGGHLWSRRFGGRGDETPRGVAIAAGGDVVLTGTFPDTIDFGGGPLMTQTVHEDAYVARFTPGGGFRWAMRVGGGAADEGNGVAVDAMDNVLVTGAFQGGVDFGGGNVSGFGGTDAFVLKLRGDGTFTWAKALGGTTADRGLAIAADSAGNVLVTGSFTGMADLGAGLITSDGLTDMFVAKYGPDGAHRWAIRGGGKSADFGAAVAADPADSVVVLGSYIGTADFGGGPLVASALAQDLVLAKYAPNGSHLWSRPIGGPGEELLGGLGLDRGGGMAIGGSFSSTADFGGGPLTARGSYDVLLLRRTR